MITFTRAFTKRLHADYRKSGDTIATVARRHGVEPGGLDGAFRRLGFKIRPHTIPQEEIDRMYADYQAGLSLTGLERKYQRNRQSLSQVFARRGLKLRPGPKFKHDPRTGRILAAVPKTPAEIEAMVQEQARQRRVLVPPALKHEWRKWGMPRRMDFITRIRSLIPSTLLQPTTPFSSNVTPFDYGTPAARKIMDEMNRGTNSRTKKAQLRPNAQGVIWKNRLWYWDRNSVTGFGHYYEGTWKPGRGRRALHHEIFREAHGPIPAGMTVIFKDGNKNNLDPANLTLRSRAECVRINRGHDQEFQAKVADAESDLAKALAKFNRNKP